MNPQQACSGAEQLVPGGLRGYRRWWGHYHSLMSINTHIRWSREMTADCAKCPCPTCSPSWRPRHAAPDERCKCGIYGWYRPDDTALTEGDVFGAVEASGRILLGTKGFRAEKARILAIATTEPNLARRWADEGVAVFDTEEELIAGFPPDDVSALGIDVDASEPERALNVWAALQALERQIDQQVMDGMAAAFRQALTDQQGFTDPVDPRARALQAAQNRNTGPRRDPHEKRGRS